MLGKRFQESPESRSSGRLLFWKDQYNRTPVRRLRYARHIAPLSTAGRRDNHDSLRPRKARPLLLPRELVELGRVQREGYSRFGRRRRVHFLANLGHA